MIGTSALSVRLQAREVVRDVSLHLAKGEFVGLVGPNGAGKSTLLKAIAGLVAAQGRVTLEGRPLARFSLAERARRIAYLPQTRLLAWNLRVGDVVALGRLAAGGRAFGRPDPGEDEAVTGALEAADALHLRARPFQALSGGEQARVHFARLLASPAPVLLLDEPCGALDIAHQLALMQTLKAQARAGRAVLVVLHDLHLAERFCSRLLVMKEGQILADAPASEALGPERLREVFGVCRAPAGGFARLAGPDPS